MRLKIRDSIMNFDSAVETIPIWFSFSQKLQATTDLRLKYVLRQKKFLFCSAWRIFLSIFAFRIFTILSKTSIWLAKPESMNKCNGVQLIR